MSRYHCSHAGKTACCRPDGANEENILGNLRNSEMRGNQGGGWRRRKAGRQASEEAGRRERREGAKASRQAGERTAGENRNITCRGNTSHATATVQQSGEHLTIPTEQPKRRPKLWELFYCTGAKLGRSLSSNYHPQRMGNNWT